MGPHRSSGKQWESLEPGQISDLLRWLRVSRNAGAIAGATTESESEIVRRSKQDFDHWALFEGRATEQIPHHVFVSYFFRAPETRDRILAALPDNVVPDIPEVALPDPASRISDYVVPRIERSDALIFSSDPVTWLSFWVPFERDVAIEAGKTVFGYMPEQGTFHRYLAHPLRIPLMALWSREDQGQVAPIIRFMREERRCRLLNDGETLSGSKQITTTGRLEELWSGGGYPVVFWSVHSATSPRIRESLDALMSFPPIFALLEPIPAPGPAPPSQLFAGDGLSMLNLTDSLVARLHWLCRRNLTQKRRTRNLYRHHELASIFHRWAVEHVDSVAVTAGG